MTPRKSTNAIIIHCAATPPKMDIGAKEIAIWHRQRGFLGIGYAWVIRRNGTIEAGRREDLVGAHCVQRNRDSVGVCLVGGVAADGKTAEANFTDAQYASLKGLLTDILTRYPGAEVIGHRDVPGVHKDCPSFPVREWWAEQQEAACITQSP